VGTFPSIDWPLALLHRKLLSLTNMFPKSALIVVYLGLNYLESIMSRKRPVSEESVEQAEGVAPVESSAEGVAPVAKAPSKKQLETPFQKVSRRLARAKRAYEALPEADDPDSPEYKDKAKAKAHLDGCVARYAKVANPEPELEVAEPA
jgi:hypothetical protein